ncbi:ferredoxin [Streptomyces sp. ISID311]|uniref:ferredoxin n=1 Tax=Streptomyces sp. ISID311 TaxID=2601673 RepID=UPI0011BD3BEF|nr:ferredoxin [Streptomyces sp. ISID311]TXC96842.1 ferredoxin [Streptomyces sp. ISID311]
MKIIIDEDKCVGAGQCVLAADEVFDQRDEDGIVILLDPSPSDDLSAQVENAALLCPALAIEVVK